MKEDFENASSLGTQKYKKSTSKFLQYGTAGFREKALELPHVMYRMGLLAVLRSKALKGETVGVMITASHNPEEDNGIKLCEQDGRMCNKEWENFATDLVNIKDDCLPDCLNRIACSSDIDYSIPANVFIARDTRKSSEALANAALDGIKILKSEVKDFGLLSTPQLHFVVCCQNFPAYGTPTLEGYYKKLSTAFDSLVSQYESCKKEIRYIPEVHVDGANGVGALKLKEMLSYIHSLNFKIFNDGTNGILNFKCGADHVKVTQSPPEGCEILSSVKYASFDGDADRLVYFYKDKNGAFHLLDGDKIATLVASFFTDLLQVVELNLRICVVQTAYANGSSTNFIQNILKTPVVCVPTGVKHLHSEALKYDIGIYFEANGHGTILFSKDAKKEIQKIETSSKANAVQQSAAKMLMQAINLVNESVGDAISDLLLTEAILKYKNWSIEDWDAMYQDFPNRQIKVKVPDRNVFTTTDAERKCVKPEGFQEAIDNLVQSHERGRAFVRPSGTEDVVRVYAEAATQDEADKLANDIGALVKEFTEK
ncbi:phosphoacetylglucosamine mutase [Caerostris darwini]|uniref:Phosphoacetylglucosamine mutase n=1 Tax=Caerostris darwini TaxID=1538125 RepID=A0AAV4PLP8_9ARAC|nr:phosphoacetylglucosamine mutase [Caerostris darwini]